MKSYSFKVSRFRQTIHGTKNIILALGIILLITNSLIVMSTSVNASTFQQEPDNFVDRVAVNPNDDESNNRYIVVINGDPEATVGENVIFSCTVSENPEFLDETEGDEENPGSLIPTQNAESPSTTRTSPHVGQADEIVPDEAPIFFYRWDYNGDGIHDTDWIQNPQGSYSYSSPAVYTVSCQVKDNLDEIYTGSLDIEILNEPENDNEPPEAYFEYSSSPKINSPVLFNAEASIDPDGQIISYSWDFGDETKESTMIVHHTYYKADSYDVTLTVTDNNDKEDSITKTIVVTNDNQLPIAILNGPSFGLVNAFLAFDASPSTDPDGEISSYLWDFGDDTQARGESVEHAFTEEGTYQIKLTVVDNLEAEQSTTHEIIIASPNIPPIANAGGPYKDLVNTPITFNGSLSYDPDGYIIKYTWDFGDNSTGDGMIVNHTYEQPGLYIVSLTVIDNNNGISKNTTTALIMNKTDTSSFKPSVSVNFPNEKDPCYCTITISSEDFTGQSICYRINYGDNTGYYETPKLPAPTVTSAHKYKQGGTYTITVQALNGNGNTLGEIATEIVEIPLEMHTEQSYNEQAASFGFTLPAEPLILIAILICSLIAIGILLFYLYKRKKSYSFETPMDL